MKNDDAEHWEFSKSSVSKIEIDEKASSKQNSRFCY